MSNDDGITPGLANANTNLLPKTLTVFQISFLLQVIVGILILVIVLPLGIDSNSGFIFYIIGFFGYLISVILLITASIFLTINAKRIENKILDTRKRKSSTILASTIAITIALISANIVFAIEYNLFHSIEAITVFGTANVISALILAIEINVFEHMLIQATGFTAETKGYQFLKMKPLIITASLFVVGFIIATPIYFSLVGNHLSREEFVVIFILSGFALMGMLGSIVIYFMKNKWITAFQKRVIILSKK